MAANDGTCSSFCSALLLDYDTEKLVRIKNKKVGVINRIIQLVIIGYIIGKLVTRNLQSWDRRGAWEISINKYVIIYKKGYQEFQSPYSSVTTKFKGVAVTNLSGLDLFGGVFVWDTSDLVIPPEENGAVFIMTNMIITPNQTQGTCPEDPRIKNSNCTQDSDCKYMENLYGGHGVNTGKCVQSDREPRKKVCEVYAWCPVEVDKLPMPGFNLSTKVPLLEAIRNFTLLVKNTVEFPKFKETRRNIDKDMEDLKTCEYDPNTAPLCPIFKLDKIENLAGVDFDKMAYEGGVMSVEISWNCNFDPLASHCEPKYSFRRLDIGDSPIAPGYNFRFSRYFVQDNKVYRSLIKAYGIRFVISVYGQGGKFSVVPLFLNIGSGLALLAIATVICDIVALYVVKKRKLYKENKYLHVEEENIQLQESSSLRLRNSTSSDDPDSTNPPKDESEYDDVVPTNSNYKQFK